MLPSYFIRKLIANPQCTWEPERKRRRNTQHPSLEEFDALKERVAFLESQRQDVHAEGSRSELEVSVMSYCPSNSVLDGDSSRQLQDCTIKVEESLENYTRFVQHLVEQKRMEVFSVPPSSLPNVATPRGEAGTAGTSGTYYLSVTSGDKSDSHFFSSVKIVIPNFPFSPDNRTGFQQHANLQSISDDGGRASSAANGTPGIHPFSTGEYQPLFYVGHLNPQQGSDSVQTFAQIPWDAAQPSSNDMAMYPQV
jgi:hypothetical protein